MAKLGDLVVRVGANTRLLNQGLKQAKRDIQRTTGEIQNLGRSLSMGITAPLALIGASSVKVFADFEQSMAKVKAVSGATHAEFESLTNNAQELGRTTRFTASEVSALQLEFAKLGFTSKEITQVTGATLNLAQATGSDLAQSAEVAGATLRAFGLDASETGHVTDVMAAAFSSSALDINSFQDSMKFVAPVAKAAGVTLEEATAMLGQLANNGIKGSNAGTSLRRILQEVAGTGMDFGEAMKKSAGEVINLADAKDEVGRTASSAFLVLKEGMGDVDGLTKALQKSDGAAKGMADTMDDTAEGAIKRMQSAIEGAQIEIGSALAPIMIKLAGIVSDLAGRFSSMSDGGQLVIMAVSGVAAAIGPLLVILPNLILGVNQAKDAFAALGTALKTNPLYLAAAAITAVATAAYLLYENSTDAQVEIKKLRDELNGLDKDEAVRVAAARIEVQKEAIEKQRAAVESLRKTVMVGDAVERRIHNQTIARHAEELAAMEEVLAGYEAVHAEVLASNPVVNQTTETVKKLGKATEQTTEKLKDKSHTLGFLMNQLEEVPDTDIWKPVRESTDKANESLGYLFNKLEEVPPIDYDRENMTQMEKDFEELNKNITDSINGAVNSAIVGFGMMLGEGIATGQGMKGIGSMLLGVFADLAIQLGTLSIGYGIAIEQIKVALASLAGPVAIAAGVALVALGAGLKCAIAKRAEESGVPAFAEGGLVYGPTMGLVGEYPGARTNPEVIAPLDKLRGMLGGQAVQVTGKISGRDILLTSERNAIDRNRVRGF